MNEIPRLLGLEHTNYILYKDQDVHSDKKNCVLDLRLNVLGDKVHVLELWWLLTPTFILITPRFTEPGMWYQFMSK